MLALVKTERGEGHLELIARPTPEPAPGWVRIAVIYAGICGTDLHIVHDRFPSWPPVTLGHEFVGRVDAVGGLVDPGWIGARVVSEPHSLACGTCQLCRRGIAELCASKRSPGWGIDGAFSASLTMPVHLLHRVPDGVPDSVAALTEPMAIAVTALLRARVDPGDTVLVVGAGPVGILAAVAARAMGAGRVLVAGRPGSDRLAFAATLGFGVADGSTVGEAVRRSHGRTWRRSRRRCLGYGRRHRPRHRGGQATRPDGSRSGSAACPVSRPVGCRGQQGDRPDLLDEFLVPRMGAGRSGSSRAPGIALEPMVTVFPLVDWSAAFDAVAARTVIKALLDPVGPGDHPRDDPDHRLRPPIDRCGARHPLGRGLDRDARSMPDRRRRGRGRRGRDGPHRAVRPDHGRRPPCPAGSPGSGSIRRRARHRRHGGRSRTRCGGPERAGLLRRRGRRSCSWSHPGADPRHRRPRSRRPARNLGLPAGGACPAGVEPATRASSEWAGSAAPWLIGRSPSATTSWAAIHEVRARRV